VLVLTASKISTIFRLHEYDKGIAKAVTDFIYLHLLGEPLSHPQLGAFLECAGKASVGVGITTNGSLLGEVGDVLLHPSLQRLNLSLHSADSTAECVTLLHEIRGVVQKRPDLEIHLRLWNTDNRGDLLADPLHRCVVEYLEEQYGVTIEKLYTPGRVHSRNVVGALQLHLESPFHWPGEVAGVDERFGTCLGFHTHCAVLADGTVVPCCLDNNGAVSLGNIFTVSFSKILSSPRARALRGGFSRGEMIEPLCRSCTYARDNFSHKAVVQRQIMKDK